MENAKSPDARNKAELECMRAEMKAKTKMLVVEMKKKHLEEQRKAEYDVKNADEDIIAETKRSQAYEKRAIV